MGFRANRVLGGMVCVLALSALQVARADEDAVKLARTFKEKDTTRYKQVIKANVAGADVVATAVNKETVKEIKKTGEVVVVRENESNKVEVNGAEMPQPMGSPVTITYDKAGKLTEFKPDMEGGIFEPGVGHLIAIGHYFILPEKAIKKDDKWETELDDPAVKGKKMTIKETYLGIEKRDGKDLWKIKQTVEAQVDDAGAKASFELTALLDPTNGQLIHSEGTVKDIPTQFGPMTWTEEYDLMKPDDTKKTAEADKKP